MFESQDFLFAVFLLLVGLNLGIIVTGIFWKISSKKINNQKENFIKKFDQSKSLVESQLKDIDHLQAKVKLIPQLEEKIEKLNSKREHSERELLVFKELLKTEKITSKKKDNFLENAKESLKFQFENLANKILEEKSGTFEKKNEDHLSDILKPFKEKIKDFQNKVEQIHYEETKERGSLRNELKNLQELNKNLSKEAQNLTFALKGNSKAKGDWGEFILESFLQKAGLQKNIHYFVQNTNVTDLGNKLRPDILVKLPDRRSIVIDSKVSLNAYEEYSSTEEKTKKEDAAKSHLISVRKHINSLSSKAYQNSFKEEGDLDFVLLFMPIESALLLALSKDPDIFGEAYNQNILLVNPSTILLAIRIISNLWKQEQQTRNVKEIAEQGAKLYDKFTGFVDDFKKIGNRLKQASESYESSLIKLSSGRGNLIVNAEKLKKMGIKPQKTISYPRSLNNNEEEYK